MKLLENLKRHQQWTDDETLVLIQLQKVVANIIAPNAATIDDTGEFPWANISALSSLGLNGIFIPEAFGGTPMSYRLYLEVVATLSEACASTGIIYATNFHGIGPVVEFGTTEQCSRLLPRIARGKLGALAITEASAGSDALGMKTTFALDRDEIVVNGTKSFISNGDVAELYLVFGKWSATANAKACLSALIVERGQPGFSVVSKERKMGHNGSSTCALAFDSVRVPRSNLIGVPGDGLNILLASLNRSRPSIAAHALGIARAAMHDMVDYGNQRIQSGRPILGFQGNQFTLADLAAELVLVEHWIDFVGDLVDAGETDIALEASVAKLRASDLAMKMAGECVQMHGGYGYCKDYRAERLMRDAKITQIWEGTNQIHRQLIGRSFLRKQ